MNIIDQVVGQQKNGLASGIESICSSHPNVLEASIRYKQKTNSHLLIESTSNQVNQFGGYTGMQPKDFSNFVHNLAKKFHFPENQLSLGGDHLGPLVWQNEPSNQAMLKAKDLVIAYAQAGYTKIHLDCSMPLGGDTELPLEIVAQRTVFLVKAAERAAPEPSKLRYIVGSEVPTAGGIKDEEEKLVVTDPDAAAETIDAIRRAFLSAGLETAWERVRGLVVQPGVEFGDRKVFDYDREKAKKLSALIDQEPSLIFEAHSTDYQQRNALKALVEDHFGILKVGPWLTFALREGLVSLAAIEAYMQPENNSRLLETLEKTMLENPVYWQKHYHGNQTEERISRLFSFSDRVRYYWPIPEVNLAVEKLFHNLNQVQIPLSLLSQFMPGQFQKVREGSLSLNPKTLVIDKVWDVLEQYGYATNPLA